MSLSGQRDKFLTTIKFLSSEGSAERVQVVAHSGMAVAFILLTIEGVRRCMVT